MAHLSEEIILQGMVLGFTKAAAMSAQAGAGSLVENALLQGMVLGFTKAAAMAVQAGADSLVVERALLQAGLAFAQYQGDPILIARAAHIGE